MPDKAHMETEAILKGLEKRIAAEYSKANKEIAAKVADYYSAYERKNKQWLQDLEDGKITEQDYRTWQTGQLLVGQRWEEMRRSLAEDYSNTNDIAKQMTYNTMPDVYALNHNYATFEAEKGGKVDTSYTLYDRPTVERIIRDEPKLLPDPRPGSELAKKLAKNKDLRWNEQHVQSAVVQSILQGETLDETIERFKGLTEMNHRAAVRYARTATTGAQNAGRVDGYKRAEKLGVNMKQVWLATLDDRTRHEHRVLDGQEVDVGEPFIMDNFKIKYPGDPAAPAHLLFNCRCTVIAKVKGVDFDVSDKTQRDDKIGDMTYEEWKNDKAKPEKEQEKPKEQPKEQPKPKETTQNKPAEIDMPAPHDETAYQDEPIKPKFTPAKTKEEAVEFMQNFAENVDLKGVSRSTANKINETLAELTDKYPINKLTTIAADERKAVMSANHSKLSINPRSIGKVLDEAHDNFIKQQEANGYSIDMIKLRWEGKRMPPVFQKEIQKLENELRFTRWGVSESYENKVKATVIHEYGHIIADQYFGQMNGVNANSHYQTDPKLREMCAKWESVFQKSIDNGDIYKLSRYGRSNVKEFFAESFAAREMGEKLPDYVESLMKEVLDNGIM